jgi:hypothetical protein
MTYYVSITIFNQSSDFKKFFNPLTLFFYIFLYFSPFSSIFNLSLIGLIKFIYLEHHNQRILRKLNSKLQCSEIFHISILTRINRFTES